MSSTKVSALFCWWTVSFFPRWLHASTGLAASCSFPLPFSVFLSIASGRSDGYPGRVRCRFFPSILPDTDAESRVRLFEDIKLRPPQPDCMNPNKIICPPFHYLRLGNSHNVEPDRLERNSTNAPQKIIIPSKRTPKPPLPPPAPKPTTPTYRARRIPTCAFRAAEPETVAVGTSSERA